MNDIETLIDAYIDHTIGDEQFEALCGWLREDAEHRRAFARKLAMHSAITEWCVERSGSPLASNLSAMQADTDDLHAPGWIDELAGLDSQDNEADTRPMTPADLASIAGYALCMALKQRAGYSVMGIAAALAIAVTLVFFFNSQNDTDPSTTTVSKPPPPPAMTIVASLTAERDAVWDRRPGQDLYAGQRFTLTQGFAEITTRAGAIALLEAPATIELLENDNALFLHRGRLVGLCHTPSSIGFTVRTQYGEVKDVGTEFGVDLNAEHFTTTVLSGQVEVKLLGEPAQVLGKHQTAHMDTNQRGNSLRLETGIAAGFETLIQRPALTPAKRWQSCLALLDDSLGLVGRIEFQPDGLVATPGCDPSFNAELIGGSISPGDTDLRTAASLNINQNGEHVDLLLDPSIRYKQLTFMAWVKTNPPPGQNITTLLHWSIDDNPTTPSWQIRPAEQAIVLGQDTKPSAKASAQLRRISLPDGWQNDWRCFAAVIDSESQTVEHYVDGRHIGSSQLIVAGSFSLERLHLGSVDPEILRGEPNPRRHINGQLGTFLIFDRALPAEQVRLLHQESKGLFKPAL